MVVANAERYVSLKFVRVKENKWKKDDHFDSIFDLPLNIYKHLTVKSTPSNS